MLVKIANREDLLQKQSDLGQHCLLMPFWQATCVLNFRTFTIHCVDMVYHFLAMFHTPQQARK